MDKPSPPTIKELYPDLTDEECREVEETWDQYLGLVAEIYDRIAADDKLYAAFRALTEDQASDTMPKAARRVRAG